ncbi:hypothetical protein Pmar_PMAR001735 [Perkinsus marinus ATCC 50983]|uniref:Uncharacterized protein n=1 Tax=Perkinsus marinus (strain ATCC 50983 / TXsc) TaxID=423536 RepID=C5KBQ0_PERM5|nr:hypothetical protein Pmar_PMAR001735 [Perkinsus marinus ATCC 50983]EER18093.1 hypothetical protein Pmar_PMAR001735 [Perkinsus marinus ATCC 50983]|eukprot:XP_002786297.1 hypothetical protein Pmar_PMAR001735 [Perkinsus marinus ATCC 50983]
MVSVPDFVTGDGFFVLPVVLYENFSEAQDFARENDVTRILFDNALPEIVKGSSYDPKYWTEVVFVTDGNCGSACSIFTQTLQLTRAATAFTFGGLADQAMDVASFGGGNVLEYDDIFPLLNIASHLGYWATFGESD